MRFTLVSSTPWTPSNRGMDILAEMLVRNNQQVSLITFPNFPWSKSPITTSLNVCGKTIESLNPKSPFIGYIESLMWWSPRFLFHLLQKITTYTIPSIDFENTDIVILESGKPLLLLDKIPLGKKIIYRQSDPLELVLSKNPYFIELEHRIIKRADLTIVVRKSILKYYQEYYPELTKKMVVSVNGFNIPLSNIEYNPYYSNDRPKGVYLGYSPIDWKTLVALAENIKDAEFHIIGNCLSKIEANKLKKYKNVILHGNMRPNKYIPYIKNADFAIIPYKLNWSGRKWIGLNSKYLMFMFFGLPIVSYRVGALDEFNNLDILFCDTQKEFVEAVKKIASRPQKLNYDINWAYYSKEGRMAELKAILSENGFI